MISTPWHASRSVHTSSLARENCTRGKSSGQGSQRDFGGSIWHLLPMRRERKGNDFNRLPSVRTLTARCDAALLRVYIGKCTPAPCTTGSQHPSPVFRNGSKANSQLVS